MHIIDVQKGMLGSAPIVAGTISLALGAALASKIRSDHRVTVAFFGDGAAGEGVLHESLNFAALRALPIIFVCENNLYSTHMSIRECLVPDLDHACHSIRTLFNILPAGTMCSKFLVYKLLGNGIILLIP